MPWPRRNPRGAVGGAFGRGSLHGAGPPAPGCAPQEGDELSGAERSCARAKPRPRTARVPQEAIGDVSPLARCWDQSAGSSAPCKALPGGEGRGRAVKRWRCPLQTSKAQLLQPKGAPPAASPPFGQGVAAAQPPQPPGTGEVPPLCHLCWWAPRWRRARRCDGDAGLGCEQTAALPPLFPPISLSPRPLYPVLGHHRAVRLLAGSVLGRNLLQGASVAQVSRGDSPELTEMIIKQSKAAGRAPPARTPLLFLFEFWAERGFGAEAGALARPPHRGQPGGGARSESTGRSGSNINSGSSLSSPQTGGEAGTGSRDADGDRRDHEISFLFPPLRAREPKQCATKPGQSSRAAGLGDQSCFP